MSNIKHLDLSHNSLTKLPLDITKFTNLETLNLSDNSITKVPSELEKLPYLKELNMTISLIYQKELRILKN